MKRECAVCLKMQPDEYAFFPQHAASLSIEMRSERRHSCCGRLSGVCCCRKYRTALLERAIIDEKCLCKNIYAEKINWEKIYKMSWVIQELQTEEVARNSLQLDQ